MCVFHLRKLSITILRYLPEFADFRVVHLQEVLIALKSKQFESCCLTHSLTSNILALEINNGIHEVLFQDNLQ